MEHCVEYYSKHHEKNDKFPNQISVERLNTVDMILKSAYVDDLSIHFFRDDYFNYLFHCIGNVDWEIFFIKHKLVGTKTPLSESELKEICRPIRNGKVMRII